MTVKNASDDMTTPTIASKVFSMSYGCKTRDGRHIFGDNGRCLMCWRMEGTTGQASRVLVIVISADDSERERVDRLAEIVEAQVRGILATMALVERGNRQLDATPKMELQVCAS
jgi:hypothetical protein